MCKVIDLSLQKLKSMRIALLLLCLISIQSTGQLTFGPEISVNPPSTDVVDVQLADIDGDLDLDLVSVHTTSGVRWYENLGGGTYDTHVQISSLVGSGTTTADGNYGGNSLEVADFDGDTDLDVAFFNTDPQNPAPDNQIVWFMNDGAGNFSSGIPIGTPGGYNGEDIIAVDMDGDLDLDVLFCEASSDHIGWIENLGGGSFGSIETINQFSTNGPADVDAADFDGDGDVDVVCIGEYEDNISWYENLGTGNWGGQQIIGTGNGGHSVSIGDFDGDTDMDIACCYFIDNKLVWHENLGSGNWGAETEITTALSVIVGMNAKDLDLDGDLDLLSVSRGDNKVAWYENTGGAFGTQQIISSLVEGAFGVDAGDMDQDGDEDVVVANFDGDELLWFENTSPVTDGCTDPTACNYDPTATVDDGSCTFPGCTDSDACNYDPDAGCDDGNCESVDAFILDWDGPTTFCVGDGLEDLLSPGIINVGNSGQNSALVITDENGVIEYAGGNFFVDFEDSDPGTCYVYSVNYQNDTEGLAACFNLADVTGCFDVSDPIIVTKQTPGCTDPIACNYDAGAECEDGSCHYACPGYECDGVCIDLDDDGTCDIDELAGCTDPLALNYHPAFTEDDGGCTYLDESICGPGTIWDELSQTCIGTGGEDCSCPADFDDDGLVSTLDLLEFLSVFGAVCP
jgi:hypothetical protein